MAGAMGSMGPLGGGRVPARVPRAPRGARVALRAVARAGALSAVGSALGAVSMGRAPAFANDKPRKISSGEQKLRKQLLEKLNSSDLQGAKATLEKMANDKATKDDIGVLILLGEVKLSLDEDATDVFNRLFDIFDDNKDGFITHDEIKTVFRALGQQLTDEEVWSIIRAADRDGNGKLDRVEYLNMMNQRPVDPLAGAAKPKTAAAPAARK